MTRKDNSTREDEEIYEKVELWDGEGDGVELKCLHQKGRFIKSIFTLKYNENSIHKVHRK